MASIAASYLVQVGLFQGSDIKLVRFQQPLTMTTTTNLKLTFGQPRTGNYDWASWHDDTFPFSYRIVHHRDIGPHIPPQKQYESNDDFFHHRCDRNFLNVWNYGVKNFILISWKSKYAFFGLRVLCSHEWVLCYQTLFHPFFLLILHYFCFGNKVLPLGNNVLIANLWEQSTHSWGQSTRSPFFVTNSADC